MQHPPSARAGPILHVLALTTGGLLPLDCAVLYWKGQAIDVQIPGVVVLQVTEAAPGAKGNTAGGRTEKPVTLETGANLQGALHEWRSLLATCMTRALSSESARILRRLCCIVS